MLYPSSPKKPIISRKSAKMPPILAIFSILLLGTFLQETVGNKPGPLKFSVEYSFGTLENAWFKGVHITQADHKCNEPLEIIYRMKEFSVGWKKCPQKVEEHNLKKIKIHLTFAYGNNYGLREMEIPVHLGDYSDELMKSLFAGGEVEIVLKDFDKPKLTYVRDANGKYAIPAGILTMDVEFENNKDIFFDQLNINNHINPSGKCKPQIHEGGKKFTINLAECNMKEPEDVKHLGLMFTFVLPNTTEKLPQMVAFMGLSEDLLHKFYDGGKGKIVFQNNKHPQITYLEGPDGAGTSNASVDEDQLKPADKE